MTDFILWNRCIFGEYLVSVPYSAQDVCDYTHKNIYICLMVFVKLQCIETLNISSMMISFKLIQYFALFVFAYAVIKCDKMTN